MGYCSFREEEDYKNGKEDFERYGREDYSRESYREKDDAYFDGFNEAKREAERREEERRQEEREQEEDYLRHQAETQRQQDEEDYNEESLMPEPPEE